MLNTAAAMLFVSFLHFSAAAATLTEIDRGHSWVSPYWGYCGPKIASDGTRRYTVGLWGESTESSEGVVYRWNDGAWKRGASLHDIYQPPLVLLDSENRLVVVYTRSSKPAAFLRARTPFEFRDFDPLTGPPDMTNAYYPGAAIASDVLYFAYIDFPDHSMRLARLNLKDLTWSPSTVIQPGQSAAKPKTVWTYPILVPAADGLHLFASNAPDGGEGNTYNEIWHVLVPPGAAEPTVRERVAATPMGTISFALDAAVDAEQGLHVAMLWNVHRYGDPLSSESAAPGLYHAYRAPRAAQWEFTRIAPPAYAGFHQAARALRLVFARKGTLNIAEWSPSAKTWSTPSELLPATALPATLGFFDVLHPASGSVIDDQPSVVCDGLLPADEDENARRVLWSILP